MTTNRAHARAAILAIGNELLDGRVRDTNSHFLCTRLKALGIAVVKATACPDDQPAIVAAFEELRGKAEFVICCGGLGPTSDDLTREAAAQFAGVGLRFDEEIFGALKARYAKRGVQMDESNKRQAYVPETAEILQNSFGTAPGFHLRCAGFEILALPGVPAELKGMYAEVIEPLLKVHGRPGIIAAFRIFGRPEAKVNSIMREVNVDPRISVSYRADFPEVHLQLSAEDGFDLGAETVRVRNAVGPEYIVSEDPDSGMSAVLVQLLIQTKHTLAVAESCTGGLAGALLTDPPGASAAFLGGVQCYSNQAKVDLLNVAPETLDKHGAVSAETALELALGSRRTLKSAIGVSITGIAGPGGGTDQKPVGTFYIGLCAPGIHCAYKHFLPSSRDYVRRYAAFMALDTVRRFLIGATPLGEAVDK